MQSVTTEKSRFIVSALGYMSFSEEWGDQAQYMPCVISARSKPGIRQMPVHIRTTAGHVKPNYCGEEAFLILRPHQTPALITPALAHHHCTRPWLSSSCAQKCPNSQTGFHRVQNRWSATPPPNQLHYPFRTL